MATIFTYSIANDTLNGELAASALTNEIRANSITIALVGVSQSGDVLTIEFKANLSAAEETELNNIVAAHEGKRALEDPVKTQWVDNNGNAIGSTEINGVRRLALDLNETLTGPQGAQGETGPQGPQGDTGPAGPVSVFGTEFQTAESLSESSTTSSSYHQKLRFTTADLPSGQYYVQWNMFARSTDDDMEVRVQLNDTTTLKFYELDVSSGDVANSLSGVVVLNLSGVNNFDMDFNDDGGGTAFLSDARFIMWRIS